MIWLLLANSNTSSKNYDRSIVPNPQPNIKRKAKLMTAQPGQLRCSEELNATRLQHLKFSLVSDILHGKQVTLIVPPCSRKEKDSPIKQKNLMFSVNAIWSIWLRRKSGPLVVVDTLIAKVHGAVSTGLAEITLLISPSFLSGEDCINHTQTHLNFFENTFVLQKVQILKVTWQPRKLHLRILRGRHEPRVSNHLVLDCSIRAIMTRLQAWKSIYFHQPYIQRRVHDEVKSQNLRKSRLGKQHSV